MVAWASATIAPPKKCHFDLCFLLSMNPFPNSYISNTGVLLNFRLHMVNVSEYAVLGGSCARFLTPTTRHDACMWVFLININHIFPFPLQTMLTAISMSAIATNGVVPGNNFNLLLQVYLLLVVLVLYFFFFLWWPVYWHFQKKQCNANTNSTRCKQKYECTNS